MTEPLPISCILCRRKKIKCNKKRPCNQCLKRKVPCEFPSTFRNIKVDMDSTLKSTQSLLDDYNRSLHEDFLILRNEFDQLLRNNQFLVDENLRMSARLNMLEHNAGSHASRSPKKEDKCISMTGETTEQGPKYYGPQLSNYMMQSLIDRVKHKQKSDLRGPEKNERPSIATQDLTLSMDKGDSGLLHNYDKQDDTQLLGHNTQRPNIVEQSLAKKAFPNVTYYRRKGKNQLPDRDVVIKLLQHFFESNEYYQTFVPKDKVFEFIEQYPLLRDQEWENDDDLLLLYILLALTVYRLLLQQCVDFGLVSPEDIQRGSKLKQLLCKNVLLHEFNRLRHNLLTELVILVTAYIISTEYYFMDQRYEESWLMIFHICLIAYLIGLHIMGKIRQQQEHDVDPNRENIDKRPLEIKSEKFEEDDEEMQQDLQRYKLWLALRNFTGQVCLILGRPNPILIHVTKVVQLSLRDSNTDALERLDDNKVDFMLKLGFSECLRLSNLMLIENFLINFNWEDLFSLGIKFMDEISNLEWALHHDATVARGALDSVTRLPKHTDRRNVLLDLIVLYVNRAKLFEPFLTKFDKSPESDNVTKNVLELIFKFCDYALMFLQEAIQGVVFAYGVKLLDQAKLLPEFNFGKIVRMSNPFLHAFFYQGVIVIFTFIYCKTKEFIKDGKDLLCHLNRVVLDRIETLIREFMIFDEIVTNSGNNLKMWLPKITNLFNRILQRIDLIHERQAELEIPNPKRFKVDEAQAGQTLTDSDSDIYGFNFNDPFWFTTPENLPYYLSSPSDDEYFTNCTSKNLGDTLNLGDALPMPYAMQEMSQSGKVVQNHPQNSWDTHQQNPYPVNSVTKYSQYPIAPTDPSAPQSVPPIIPPLPPLDQSMPFYPSRPPQ